MKKQEARIAINNLLIDSKLTIINFVEWEGREDDRDAAEIEKQRLLEEIMKIVYK